MFDFLFAIRRIVGDVVLPPSGFTLIALAGLVIGRKHPRFGRSLTTISLLIILFCAMPIGAELLVRSVSYPHRVEPEALKRAQAIVILGGGLRRHGEEFGEATGETLGRWTVDRVRYGAYLAKQTGLPVLTTGGVPYGPSGASESAIMARALEREFGVPVRWQEDRSGNTRQNAVLTAALLREGGVQRIALVTHAFHIPRAVREFEAVGLEVIPAPTFIAGPFRVEPLMFVPTMRAFEKSHYVMYEWLARLINGSPKP